MDVKGALGRKFGPLPAWAWLVFLAGVLYFYRKYHATSTSIGTSGTAPDPTPPTPQDPVVLQPGESVYDPNTGQLVGGSGDPGGSGGGTDGKAPDSPGAGPGAGGGGSSGGANGTGGGGRSGGGRKPKRVKLNVKSIARAGSALQGAKRLSKPRSNTHTRAGGKRKQAKSTASGAGADFMLLTKGRRRKNVTQTEHKGVRPKTTHIQTRQGRSRPMVTKTENQRPAAKGPAAPKRQSSSSHPVPPPRAVAHNPTRTVHAGSPPRVARPRTKR